MAPPPPAPDPPDPSPDPQTGPQTDPLGSKQRPLSSGSDSGYSGSSGSNPDHLAPSGSTTSLAAPLEEPEDKEVVMGNRTEDKGSPDNGTPLILINGKCTKDPSSRICDSTLESRLSNLDDSVLESTDEVVLCKPSNRTLVKSQRLVLDEEMVVLPERFRRNRNRPCAKSSSTGSKCTCNHGNHGDSQVNKEPETPDNACSCSSDVIKKDAGDVIDDVTSCPDCGGWPPPGRTVEEGEDGRNHDDRRRADVGLALQWLRQQMLLMKEQDKVLMRQFLDLRASIHGLRGAPISPSSATDLSSPSFSSSALTTNPSSSLPWLLREAQEDAPLLQGLRGDECEVEFRARTVSMVPARPKSKLQTRAFSKEFV